MSRSSWLARLGTAVGPRGGSPRDVRGGTVPDLVWRGRWTEGVHGGRQFLPRGPTAPPYGHGMPCPYTAMTPPAIGCAKRSAAHRVAGQDLAAGVSVRLALLGAPDRPGERGGRKGYRGESSLPRPTATAVGARHAVPPHHGRVPDGRFLLRGYLSRRHDGRDSTGNAAAPCATSRNASWTAPACSRVTGRLP